MTRLLVDKRQWGGVLAGGAKSDKSPYAALTRNVIADESSAGIVQRGGSASIQTIGALRSHDTLWALTIPEYPDEVFIVQVSPPGVMDEYGNWSHDMSGTGWIKHIGVVRPERVSSDITATGVEDIIWTEIPIVVVDNDQ
jgi:hypothetical protein